MKYILYNSNANIAEVNLLEILNLSRQNNQQASITGILLTHSTGFIQYIEGPNQQIDELYFNKIVEDERHDNVTIIKEATISERAFGCWDMGYLCVNDKSLLTEVFSKNGEFQIVKFYSFVNKSLPLVE